MLNITLPRSEVQRVLALTQSIVEKKTSMPVLSNVLLSSEGSELRASATDLEIAAVVRVPAQVHSPGSTTVNAKVFGEIVRELPEADVNLKVTEGERLEITSLNSKLRIIGVSAAEYPSLPGIGMELKHTFPAGELLRMVNQTIYAVSLDETRFNLSGVCFESVIEKGEVPLLRMVATDGHRLALTTRPSRGLRLNERVIVPRKGLAELRKLLDANVSSEVGIDIREGFLVVDTKDAKLSMRLVDGEFPDYRLGIPTDTGVMALAPVDELAQALRRVAVLLTDKAKCVKLDFSENNLRISSSSPELGDARESIAVDYKGAPVSIGFNARYLLDIAQALGEGGTLHIELHGETGPGKFWADGDESSLAIVMPMRL